MSNSQNTYQTAVQEADVLIDKINQAHGDLQPAYLSLENAIIQYEQSGHIVDELIPAEPGGTGVGFSLFKDKGNGKKFWEIYFKSVMKELCDPKNNLHQYTKVGAQTTTFLVVNNLISTLSLPLMFIAPIAAILVSKGIDALCESMEEDKS